jgi:transposase
VSGKTQESKTISPSEVKTLKHQNKALKKELHRKDKALAETAALLVLQKKVKEIWGNDDEDNSQ